MKRFGFILLPFTFLFVFAGFAGAQNDRVFRANGESVYVNFCGSLGCGNLSVYRSGDSQNPQTFLNYGFSSYQPDGGSLYYSGYGNISNDSLQVGAVNARLQVNAFSPDFYQQVCNWDLYTYQYTCNAFTPSSIELEWKQDHLSNTMDLINSRQVTPSVTSHVVGQSRSTSATVNGTLLGMAVNNVQGSIAVQHETRITITRSSTPPVLVTVPEMKADSLQPASRLHASPSRLKRADYTFSQVDYPGATATRIWGINDTGAIVGAYMVPDVPGQHAFKMNKGVFTTVGPEGAIRSVGRAINNAGQIVGTFADQEGIGHAFLYTNGGYQTIDYPDVDAQTTPTGIASDGTVVGFVLFDSSALGFVFRNGKFTTYSCGPTTYTQFQGVSANNVIVGNCDPDPATYLAIWGPFGNLQQYMLPGAFATGLSAVSSNGLMVGNYEDSDQIMHGFAFDGNDVAMVEYPGSGQTRVQGVNASGQIVGFYDSGAHGFVAKPVNPQKPI